ncbi:hypothetical protein SY85_24705 [Flavisolibacter tropicus]|uniref:RagB/SusD domain-containing protein n=1 Tax=Flavisolibacter tropicus TaxID=1492898 RepID=A0A172U1Y5_9BACT|nr:hypothetical protein SY85_24705 [Flavisolibacter tropicus]
MLEESAPLQVGKEEIFSTEQGFKEVINGVYLQMGTQDMYGRDLSYGMLSVLGRSYDTTIKPELGELYYQAAQYNFQNGSVRSVMSNIWKTSYSSIANINYMLENMESHKALFTGNNYNTIKGEGLGLRAFLHFELLRLYAPSPAASGLTALAIPYMTKFSPYAVASSTTGVVLDSCIADLKNAEALLSETDMNTSRFSVWAAKGLLARLYLYKGDNVSALQYAKALINSGKFPLATATSDFLFSKEYLFSLYTFQNNIGLLYKTVFNTKAPLGLSVNGQTALFVTGAGSATADWRKSFVDPATGSTFSGTLIQPRKFVNSATTNNYITPLIRMTEMYYIAAECAAGNNDLGYATDLMDTVRVHRNLAKYTLASLPADSLNTEIKKEYQKEFLGEGQAFYYFKRKNLPISALPFTRVPVVAGASYVFVRPE